MSTKSQMCINRYASALEINQLDLAIHAINFLANKAKDEAPEAARVLKDHAYVDDIAASEATPDKAKEVTSGVDAILAKGKFAIKAWHSNNPKVDQASSENCELTWSSVG